jgi:hypothetical protein
VREKPARILKADNVKLEGRFRLGSDRSGPVLSKQRNMGSGIPQVRIVEKSTEFAVIEIICSCGTRTSLRCEYADVGPSAGDSRTQNNESGIPVGSPGQAK